MSQLCSNYIQGRMPFKYVIHSMTCLVFSTLKKYCAYGKNINMLFAGREVRIGKNCARGLEYGPTPQAEGLTQD